MLLSCLGKTRKWSLCSELPEDLPVTNDGETYMLTVQAKDEMNNVKKAPSNLTTCQTTWFVWKTWDHLRQCRPENVRQYAAGCTVASQLRKKDGSIATGKQDAVRRCVRMRPSALRWMGFQQHQGEQKRSVGSRSGWQPQLPYFPSTSGVSGTSEFMLNIEELSKSKDEWPSTGSFLPGDAAALWLSRLIQTAHTGLYTVSVETRSPVSKTANDTGLPLTADRPYTYPTHHSPGIVDTQHPAASPAASASHGDGGKATIGKHGSAWS